MTKESSNKRHCTLAIIFAILSIILTGCGGTLMTNVWSHSGLTHNEKADSWEINAKKVNGYADRKIDFTAGNLASLNVESTNSGGNVSILLTQGDTKKVIDITGEYSGNIDTGDFESGHIEIRLDFDNAENVDLTIKW